MRLDKPERQRGIADGLTGIAAIYKVSLSGEAKLIGTGFWVTGKGHLVTAWHVIADNIGADGVDEGPIYAMQTYPNRKAVPRVLRKTMKHKLYDLALSETVGPDGDDADPTWTFSMTLNEAKVGEFVGTYSFVAIDQSFEGEKYEGITTDRFNGKLAIPEANLVFDLTFATRINTGEVLEIFPEKRDSVIMPFPCFCSDIPIYGANSGGPVFDRQGRVCGVNGTSIAGQDVSFHMPLKGILDLWARDIEFIPEDPVPRARTVCEMALARRIHFHPPIEKYLFHWWALILLKPYLLYMNALAWARRKIFRH